MANVYWVGGSGAWDDINTANWSATSGGAGGYGIPSQFDSVFFDNVGNYTVTLSAVACQCLNFTVAGGSNKTFVGTSSLIIYGSMSILTDVIWNATSVIQFKSTITGQTINTNNEGMTCNILFNGIGGEWTLTGALNTTGILTLNAGILNTAGFAVTAQRIDAIAGSDVRQLNLGSSTVTLSTTTTPLNFMAFGGSLTFNAGTSTIILSGNITAFSLASVGYVLYNITFTNTTARTLAISTTTTFNNFYVTGPATVGIVSVTFAANTIINGALGTLSTAGNRRVFFQSSTVGMQRDLFCNSAASLTDANFRDLYVKGTAAPISGTRVGNLGGCYGITFSTPKTVYWNLAAGGNWSATAWALSSGGSVSTDNYPLAQDIAIIGNTGLNTSATLTVDAAALHLSSIDLSGRTLAMTFQTSSTTPSLYGDFKVSSAVFMSGFGVFTFAGRNTQTITFNGSFNNNLPITINSIGGTVQLASAFACGNLTLVNGTFSTNGFAFSASTITSNASTIRRLNLANSAVTIAGSTPIQFVSTNFTFDAGTSTITLPFSAAGTTGPTFTSDNLQFYNVAFTGASTSATTCSYTFTGAGNSFNNLSIAPPQVSGGLNNIIIPATMTVNGTFNCSGGSAIRRNNLLSVSYGTPSIITCNTLIATDADFRDITIAGAAAAGGEQTRLGNLGGNSPVGLFPAGKTVYWNLTGAQNWSAIAWAPTSGGTPAINNFPLAQDTAVFDDAGAATTVTYERNWVIGNITMSSRTTAMTLASGTNTPQVYGNLTLGTGVTLSGTSSFNMIGRSSTKTITSNGRTFTQGILVFNLNGIVQLGDALICGGLNLNSGTFDAGIYNVTTASFTSTSGLLRTLKMGSGTWTVTGTGTIWNITSSLYNHNSGTATVVLSNNTTTARTWTGAGTYYNKLTIGGTSSTSTTTFSSADTFGELASTKTVAHTVALTGGPSIGLWSITGTVGNVVTITGTINLVGARVSGVNYLALGTTTITATNPVEFYAGVNSTGTGINTAAPVAVTRYWRGGTGTWNATTTTNWSASSGGAGGASVPTSADTVIFNGASNGTAYTVTLTATQLRCATLTITGPFSGAITFAGTAPLSVTQAFTMAATNVTRTYTGFLTFSGTGAGKTISIGQSLATGITINGIGASWALTSALTIITPGTVGVINGSFNTAGFALGLAQLSVSSTNLVTVSLGATALTSSTGSFGGGINFSGSSATVNPVNFTFNPGTSTITLSGLSPSFYHGGKTFNNVAFTDTQTASSSVFAQSVFTPTFNNLTLANPNSTGVKTYFISTDIIVTGTLTFTQAAGTAIRRIALISSTSGTQYSITAAAVSNLTDVDMRDINCAGAATWVGTRIGNLGGNTNAPTSTPKTVYWNLVAGGNWSATAWATDSLGTPDVNNFPLAQDTAIIENAGLNTSASVTFNASWNISSVNMSGRTSAMTLIFSTTTTVYGNWTFGTGVTSSSPGAITFSGRGTQTITSNGKAFTSALTIDNITGIVQLADALSTGTSALTLTTGTFNAVAYNVTCSSFSIGATSARTLSMGSGLWTITSSGTPWTIAGSPTLNKDTANIILTNTTGTVIFAGGGLSYNKLTIGGNTSTFSFTITGNNTFTEIASTRTVAYSIALAATTQRVAAFTVSGSAGNLVTITGSSITSFATLIYTGASTISSNYIIPTFLKVYNVTDTWYADTNSTNGGSYGWIFASSVVAYSAGGLFFAFF